MSALPPIADMCSAQAHVRFVPKADFPIQLHTFSVCLITRHNERQLCHRSRNN